MKALERSIGLFSVMAISMGAMLSGLFVLPGLAVSLTGSSAWAAFLIAGISILPAALSKAELATAMPVSGGTYVYIDRTFGPLAGTVMGLGLWISLLLKSAFALVGFGAYLYVFADVNVRTVALSLLAVVFALNVLGIRKVGKVQVVVVAMALVALLALVTWGSITFQADLLDPVFSNGGAGFVSATAVLYISYAGVTKVAAISEEVQNPNRNIPLGIMLSLVIVGVLYTVVTLILVGNVPAEQLHDDYRPIYTLAERLGGPVIGVIAAIVGILTMTSMANSGVLSASRFPFAMGRDNLLPSVFSRVHARYMTPVVGIGVTVMLIALAVIFLDVEKIAKLASSLKIGAFMGVNLAVIVLRESGAQWYRPTFRVPAYPFTPIVGILSGALLLVYMGVTGALALIVIAVPGIFLFFGYGRKRTDRVGIFGQLGPRPEIAAEASRLSGQFRVSQVPVGASVVVSLLGQERSPETLVELGVALADGQWVKVVHLTDIPEQIMLNAMLEEDAAATSLRRRIDALAQERSANVEFEPIVTRDVVKTVHTITSKLQCQWLVMEWRRAERGILFFNPLSWLIHHLSCNLAVFRHAGVRYIREILVLTAPGPHDALVVDTADHLADVYRANITFIRFVADDATPIIVQTEVDYLEQLRQLSTRTPNHIVVRGKDEVKTIAAKTASFDLLIMGALGPSQLRDYVVGSTEDRLTRVATCSVLRLRTPPGRTHKPRKRRRAETNLLITGLLKEDRVRANLPVMRKDALFSQFSQVFEGLVPAVSAREIEEALWVRERSQNTALGNGIAVPHATISATDRQYLGVFATEEPIDYQTPDGEPVDIFFVTLGPASERYNHLLLLAGISRLVVHTDLLARIRMAQSPEEILSAVGECESQLERRPV